jgi:hypothetical protein
MSTTRRFLLASSLARLIEKERGGHRVIEGYFPIHADRSSYVQVHGNIGQVDLLHANADTRSSKVHHPYPFS